MVASSPAVSRRACNSSASSRESLPPTYIPHVLLSVSKIACASRSVIFWMSFSFSSASSREAAPPTVTRKPPSSFVAGSGDKSRGSTRTRDVSSASSVLPPPVAFIRCPVVEMVAERASVVRATRIVGSGPVSVVRLGVLMTGVVAAGGVHTGCVRLGRVICC